MRSFQYCWTSDEIDSILTSRKSDEQESSRRMKTEFFAAFDGVRAGKSGNGKDGKADKSVLVIGATNRPKELDSAAIRNGTFLFICLQGDTEELRKPPVDSDLGCSVILPGQ